MKVKRSRIWLLQVALWAFLLVGASSGLVDARESTQSALWSSGMRNQRAVLRRIQPALKFGNNVARLYYLGKCLPDDRDFPPAFPSTILHRPSAMGGIVAVREIFRGSKNVIVTGDEEGLIRIRIGNAPDELLRTKISTIEFNKIDQYNPEFAITAIENVTEVRVAMRKMGVNMPPLASNVIAVSPADDEPHLPISISNVTMDQALDSVARAFRGIIVYGVCTQPRLFSVSFTGSDP